MSNPQPPLYLIGLLLRQAHRRAAAAAEEALAPQRIAGRELGVLIQLVRDGPLSQQQLVAALSSDRASMVRTVDRLEALGYVQREPVPADRRLHAVTLTSAGRRAFRKAEATASRAAAALLEGFTADERGALIALLTRFVNPPDDLETVADH